MVAGGGYGGTGGGVGGLDSVGNQELPSYNQAPAGSIRFNTDSKKLEVYILGPVGITTLPNGIWMEVDSWSPELQTGGTRAIFSGSYSPSISDAQCFNMLLKVGFDTIDFGSFVSPKAIPQMRDTAAVLKQLDITSTQHGVNEIDCNIFSSTGSAFDFGDLSESVRYAVGGSNSTRGVRAGGYDGSTSETIDYVTISEAGGTAKNFGDLVAGKYIFNNGACSQTRCIFPSGYTSGWTNVIEYVTTSTQGNAADFGDSTSARGYGQGISCSATRGLFYGGDNPAATNIIDYVTMATLGNAIDFGDSSYASNGFSSSCSPTRGVVAGGTPNNTHNNIEYVQIASIGNAVDFGDLTFNQSFGCAVSNGHGGL